jgi:hypothetical protein
MNRNPLICSVAGQAVQKRSTIHKKPVKNSVCAAMAHPQREFAPLAISSDSRVGATL